MQGAQLKYVIKFVADMDKAVKFHRDVLGLTVKFESPGWSEFATGETSLALHPASDKNPAGKVELGFTVADVEAFYRDMSAKGVLFTMPPKKQDFGGVLAQFVDSEGVHCSVGVRRRRDHNVRRNRTSALNHDGVPVPSRMGFRVQISI
jgi:predicted enzyme related to lactoylglutathione lyase